jgi:hypothetical protein
MKSLWIEETLRTASAFVDRFSNMIFEDMSGPCFSLKSEKNYRRDKSFAIPIFTVARSDV